LKDPKAREIDPQYIKENEDLDPEEIYKLAYNLAESEPTKIAKPSRLKLLRN